MRNVQPIDSAEVAGVEERRFKIQACRTNALEFKLDAGDANGMSIGKINFYGPGEPDADGRYKVEFHTILQSDEEKSQSGPFEDMKLED